MLAIENLSFGYGRRVLFNNLSLQVEPGTVTHIVGPNGAGKSTLMSIVAGLLSATDGKIEYVHQNQEVEDRRDYLEYIPAEANGLFLKLDAINNLRFWCELRGVDSSLATIEPVLEQWSLAHKLIREGFAVEKFSTGMKRRLALARLGLSPAPMWLLDEPIYGLDTEAIATFRKALEQHIASGGGCLVVSHDTEPLAGLVTHTVNLGER